MARRGRPPKYAYVVSDPKEIAKLTGTEVVSMRYSQAKKKWLPVQVKPICSKCLRKLRKTYVLNEHGKKPRSEHVGWICHKDPDKEEHQTGCGKNFDRIVKKVKI